MKTVKAWSGVEMDEIAASVVEDLRREREKETAATETAVHDCVECLTEDCDCGGNDLACNFCSECLSPL